MLAGYICSCGFREQPEQLDTKQAKLKALGCEEIFVEPLAPEGLGRCFESFEAMVDNLARGDTIVVSELSDLCGNLHSMGRKLDSMATAEVNLWCVEFDLNSNYPKRTDLFTLGAAMRHLDHTPPKWVKAAEKAKKSRGRPRALNASALARAKHLIMEEGLPVKEVADRLGVSRATIYRHLHWDRQIVEEPSDTVD